MDYNVTKIRDGSACIKVPAIPGQDVGKYLESLKKMKALRGSTGKIPRVCRSKAYG